MTENHIFVFFSNVSANKNQKTRSSVETLDENEEEEEEVDPDEMDGWFPDLITRRNTLWNSLSQDAKAQKTVTFQDKPPKYISISTEEQTQEIEERASLRTTKDNKEDERPKQNKRSMHFCNDDHDDEESSSVRRKTQRMDDSSDQQPGSWLYYKPQEDVVSSDSSQPIGNIQSRESTPFGEKLKTRKRRPRVSLSERMEAMMKRAKELGSDGFNGRCKHVNKKIENMSEEKDDDPFIPTFVHDLAPDIWEPLAHTQDGWNSNLFHQSNIVFEVVKSHHQPLSWAFQVGLCFERSIIYIPRRRNLCQVWIRRHKEGYSQERLTDEEYPNFYRQNFEDEDRELYFNTAMQFLWNKTFEPKLPFQIKDLHNDRHQFIGVEVISAAFCNYRILRDKLIGFFEILSDDVYHDLFARGYDSLVSIPFAGNKFVRCIMWGPLKYCQHEHGSPLRLMSSIGHLFRLVDEDNSRTCPCPDDENGHHMVRLKVHNLLKSSESAYKGEFQKHERIPYDYGGGEWLNPSFDCTCRICVATLTCSNCVGLK